MYRTCRLGKAVLSLGNLQVFSVTRREREWHPGGIETKLAGLAEEFIHS